MARFLAAHGYEPGPTQRPLLAGSLAGIAATVPAIALLQLFGALAVEARILGLPVVATVAIGALLMAAAGAVYAQLFGRAANDKRGGWLFGMAFGFAIWAAGAVLVLPLASGGQAPAGDPALGMFMSLLLWGAALGLLLPYVHRPLHADLDEVSGRAESGPKAATSDRRSR